MMTTIDAINDPTNNGKTTIELTVPYVAQVTIEGVAALLFHRWSNEAVEAKSKAAKGSKAKKTDDVESYVYRCPDGTIGIPGVYLVGSLIDPRNGAAKSRQDPRSPRKSALDLFKAGVVPLTDLASLGATEWDYLDSRRVLVQRNAITRVRPAFLPGWRATFELRVATPEYIPPALLHDVLVDAGRLVGVGDFRPSHGRFSIVNFEVVL